MKPTKYIVDQSEQPYPFGNGKPETFREVLAEIAARDWDRSMVERSWTYVKALLLCGVVGLLVWLWW